MRELFKSIGVSLDNRGPAGSWRDLFGYFRKNVIQIFDEIELASAFCFIEKTSLTRETVLKVNEPFTVRQGNRNVN